MVKLKKKPKMLLAPVEDRFKSSAESAILCKIKQLRLTQKEIEVYKTLEKKVTQIPALKKDKQLADRVLKNVKLFVKTVIKELENSELVPTKVPPAPQTPALQTPPVDNFQQFQAPNPAQPDPITVNAFKNKWVRLNGLGVVAKTPDGRDVQGQVVGIQFPYLVITDGNLSLNVIAESAKVID